MLPSTFRPRLILHRSPTYSKKHVSVSRDKSPPSLNLGMNNGHSRSAERGLITRRSRFDRASTIRLSSRSISQRSGVLLQKSVVEAAVAGAALTSGSLAFDEPAPLSMPRTFFSSPLLKSRRMPRNLRFLSFFSRLILDSPEKLDFSLDSRIINKLKLYNVVKWN